jgi:hypothetical protein
MALKINTQVGTNKGITNELYVRIAVYQINKIGFLRANLELFMNEDDSKLPESEIASRNLRCYNSQIDDHIIIPLGKLDEKLIKVRKPHTTIEEVTETSYIKGEDGKMEVVTKTVPKHITREMEVEEKLSVKVPYIDLIKNADVFEFTYVILKNKLISLYGEENIEDC